MRCTDNCCKEIIFIKLHYSSTHGLYLTLLITWYNMSAMVSDLYAHCHDSMYCDVESTPTIVCTENTNTLKYEHSYMVSQFPMRSNIAIPESSGHILPCD